MPEANPLSSVVEAAAQAAAPYAALPSERRAEFLDAIAARLEALGDELLQAAHEESHLPLARLTGERGRTCAQLRMFANLIRKDDWLDVRIDTSGSDLRRTQVPLGPVAVFGASNFPLAFSVPGGDTASALAAGCPVVAKAHPAHPRTSELAARAVLEAADATHMPEGVFGLVHGGAEEGRELVLHPAIRAVGFTGSQRAGRALFDLGAGRPHPIPVYAEMGSVNPVFVLPGALAERGDALAKGYADSLTLGVGQFCTNPGVLVGIAGESFDRLLDGVATHLSAVEPGTMLTESIRDVYLAGVQSRRSDARLERVCDGESVQPALFATSASAFLSHPDLQEELFGPSAIAIRCRDIDEMRQVAEGMEGQLTATVQFAPSDEADVKALLPSLVHIAGRVVANGFPTGVEVGPAMHHGGPYPATTDPRATSVGTAAILRFVRPVAYQGFPESLLPKELRTA